jgi:23S rRNA (guanosine2251-2'-O)-methyltransferase
MTPVVKKVAAGAAESVPLITVTNLSRSLKELKAAGVWLVGTSGEAENTLYEESLSGPTGLVMGAEGEGIRRLTAEACDYLVKLPMMGQVESLNVSVATGICLYEINRQRQQVV